MCCLQADTIPHLFAQLSNPDSNAQLEATTSFRKLLSMGASLRQ